MTTPEEEVVREAPVMVRRALPIKVSHVNPDTLSAELSSALGQQVRVIWTPPSSGTLPFVLVVDEDGLDVEIDQAQLDQVVAAHTPPPPPETLDQRRTRLRAAADAATSVVALRAVVKELIDRA